MAELDDEKAPQQVHPDKPGRDDDPPPRDDPNDEQPGRPQHETHDEFGDEH
jgi:hypothetical protein